VTYGLAQGTFALPELGRFRTFGQAFFVSPQTGATLERTAVADGRHFRWTINGSYYGGPIRVLAEWVQSRQMARISQTRGDIRASAWQLGVGFVVTGQDVTEQGYSFERPFQPSEGSWGVVELVARYHELFVNPEVFDLGMFDPATSADRARAAGIGITWALNRYFQVAVNYERTHFRRGDAAGDRPVENAVLGRMQFTL
jgi:phosphate-selective porin OprO and OprP